MSQRQLAMAVAVEATQMMALHSLADDRCYQPRGMFCHVNFIHFLLLQHCSLAVRARVQYTMVLFAVQIESILFLPTHASGPPSCDSPLVLHGALEHSHTTKLIRHHTQ